MSDTSKCSGRSTKSTSVQMQGLLNEFKLLYKNRLKKLELQEPHNEETNKLKIKTLESYIKDLLEQNDVLIQTIDELEKEANSRVAKLEAKLTRSNNQFKDLNIKYKNLEKDMKSLDGRNETLERELKSKSESISLLEREMSRLKASYEEAVKMLASKTKSDDSALINMSTYQNEAHLKNLEDSLSSAVKSKNELIYELKEQDKRIISLEHHNRELQHYLYEKDEEIRCLEENLNSKINNLEKLQYPSQNECKLHRDFMQVELEKEDLKLKLANINHDVSCLMSAFHNAKNSGKYELKNLFLKEISLERLNGLMGDENTKRVHFADQNVHNSHELLKAELHHNEEIIASLKQELKSLRSQYESLLNGKEIALNTIKSTLSTVHNKELLTSGQIFEKDMEIRKVKNDLSELRSQYNTANEDIENKKKELKECKLEIIDFVNEVKSLRSDIMCKDHQIYNLKEKLHEQTLQFASSHSCNSELSPTKKNINSIMNDERSQYEIRIKELKATLEESQKEKYKLVDELNQQQNKYKSNVGTTQTGLESLKFELKTRDDIIQKLRHEVLILQEKRDQIYSELDAQSAKFSQLECRLFFKEEENNHLTNRFKQSQKEIQDWKKSYEEEHVKNETNVSKFNMYEDSIQALKEKITEAQNQNQKLTVSLQNLQSGSKETRDKLSEELSKRQNELNNLQHEKACHETTIQQQIKDKTAYIEKLTNDLETKNLKIESQADKISQVTLEASMLKKRCDDQERELSDFRNRLNETKMSSSSHLSSITAQLVEKEDQLNKCQDESSRRLIAIEQLEKELLNIQGRHDSAVKEIGRLESKLQSHQIDFQNDNKILENEILKRDEKYFQMRNEKDACQSQIVSLEDKLKDYELVISSLKQQNLSYQCSYKSKEEHVRNYEKQIDDYKQKFRQASEDLSRLEEKNKAKMSDFASMTELKKELEHKLKIVGDQLSDLQIQESRNLEKKNSFILNLQDQIKCNESKMDELREKLIQKDSSVQQVSDELDRVKSMLHSRTKEYQQKNELSQSLEVSLNRSENEIVNLNKARSKLESDLHASENELEKAKTLTSQLSDNLKSVKYDLDEFKKENLQLTLKLQTFGEEKNQIVDKNQQLEMQYMTALEKNKFCQNEVSQRDQSIIKLRSDYNLIDEKYSSSLQELKIQEEEIERLNTRIKSQGYDLKEAQAVNDHLETKINGLDQMLKQKDYDIEVYKQDLMKQEKQIENIKGEWTANIRNHEEEIKGYKQNFQILNEELSHTKNDLTEFMAKINMLKSQVSELNDGLDCKRDENERLSENIRRYEAMCKDQEIKINDYISEMTMAKNQYERANNQIENLCMRINDFEHKEELNHRTCNRFEENVKNLQETIIELKFKNAEKEQESERLNGDNGNLNKLLQEKNNEIMKLNDELRGLNEEIDKMNFNLTKLEDSLRQSEITANTNFTKLTEKIDDYNELDRQFDKHKSEFKNYQQKYQFTQEEITSRNNKITQMEYELEETINHSQILKSQNQELMNVNKNSKADYDHLSEQKRNSDKEVTRLESAISELQMNFTSSSQQLKIEISRLDAHAFNLNNQLEQSEKQIQSLTNQIDLSNDTMRKLENQIANLNRDLANKNDELERVEANMKLIKDSNVELERANKEKESLLTEQINDREHMKNEVNDARHQLQHCLAEKAHIEERFMLISKNLEQIQEEIRQKVTDYVRVEQLSQKQQTEIKTLKDRTLSYEEEMDELKAFGEKLKKDLFATKEELINSQQDNSKTKNNLIKTQHELDASREQEKIITEQLVHNDNLLQQLHGDLRNERNKLQDCQRHISQLKQNVVEVTNEKELNERQVKDLTNRVKERETKIQTYQTELDATQQNLRACKEEMAEKDGHIKCVKMNLESSEKQRNHFIDEIQKYEEAVAQFKSVIENSQAKYRECHCELLQAQQQIHDLKTVISSNEFQQKETMNTVAEKSKENSYLKNDLVNLKKQNDEQIEQIKQLDDRYETAKMEFKKSQEESLQHQHNLTKYEQETYDLKQQLQALSEKQKQLIQEITIKDEQILGIKVELQCVHEKFKFKSDEADKYQLEIQHLSQRCQFLLDEQKKLEISLEKSRENGERLHKESEMVISNVNSWVHEQRNNSEKLAIKIREQATAIVYLNTEKEKFIQEIENLQQHIKKLSLDQEACLHDKEKIKALQNHLSQQQTLLQQLQGRLKEYENKMCHDNTENNKTVEELQNRLRSNIESIQILNNQVNNLQRESFNAKENLEKERAARQTLQLQLESKNQFINSFTTPSPKKCSTLSKAKSNRNIRDSPDDVGYLSSPSRSSSHHRAPLRDKNSNQFTDGSDCHTDSDYWKQKAGELSMQLEQTKKFWSNRVENLQNNIK